MDPEALDLEPALEAFASEGYARLGKLLSDPGAERLAEIADAAMQQEVPGLFYQHEPPSGRFADVRFGAGWQGPSTRYRKLERLELDPTYAAWIGNRVFERIARRLLGDDVRLYRSVLWSKGVHGGMEVPWHQDDGTFWGLDRRPFLQVWTALDDAGLDAGCLEVVPGTHLRGLASPEGGTVRVDALERADVARTAVRLAAVRGECILVHNHLWHRTGINASGRPRKALSVSFLAGDTGCTRTRRAPRTFARVFRQG